MLEWPWLWPLINSAMLLIFGGFVTVMVNQRRDAKAHTVTVALRLADAEKKRAEDLAADHAALLVRVTETEKELAVFRATMTTAMLPVSAMFQAALVKHLTHNHTPEMDDLLARIGSLNEREEARLALLLQERVVKFDDPQITDGERDAAYLLPKVMKRVKAEAAAATKTPVTMRIVTISVGDGSTIPAAETVIAATDGSTDTDTNTDTNTDGPL